MILEDFKIVYNNLKLLMPLDVGCKYFQLLFLE